MPTGILGICIILTFFPLVAVKYFTQHTQPPTHTPTPPTHTEPHGPTEKLLLAPPAQKNQSQDETSVLCFAFVIVRFWVVWRMCASLLTAKPNTQMKSEPPLFASAA